jgi:hypothetical protein
VRIVLSDLYFELFVNVFVLRENKMEKEKVLSNTGYYIQH